MIIVGNAIPSFLFAILLIVLFAGGSFVDWFPLRGLVSDNWEQLSWPARILDYFWHLTLPLISLVIGAFAGMTMLTKNSFLEEINKQYVMTARAKGLTERRVLYGHVFRNAMLIVIAGFPGAFVGILFTGALLIEIIFSLDGLGLLGFEAALKRDYPVMFASLYFFGLLGLVMQLISDLMYAVDRSAHRLRDARGLRWRPSPLRRPVPLASGCSACRSGSTRSTSVGSPTSRPTGAAISRCTSFFCCSCSAWSPSSSPTTSRS